LKFQLYYLVCMEIGLGTNRTLLKSKSNKSNTTKNTDENKQRKRKIIWFNPPFSKNVSTKVGNHFLKLINKHFPRHHKFHKLFNKNNVKVSYSCMPNMKNIINMHNKKIIHPPTKKRNKNLQLHKEKSVPSK